MSAVATVEINSSQFPEQVRRDLLESLRKRQVNHKFHYDSIKQTQKWLALHQQYSPSRTDLDCERIYNESFKAAARMLPSNRVHLVGLGCGGGQKDTRLLRFLKRAGKKVGYTPSDVSTAMVLVARKAALSVVDEKNCKPFVCDLSTANELGPVFKRHARGAARIYTFFGMIPNFESQIILPRLAKLLAPSDILLFSANLAPGPDYLAGIKKVLPLYDNALTRDWLRTFLSDLGVDEADGKLNFRIGDAPSGIRLKRIAAYFTFSRAKTLRVEDRGFKFRKGDSMRLFFSYRHTPEIVSKLLAKHGLAVEEQWITRSEEEGVFLCRKA